MTNKSNWPIKVIDDTKACQKGYKYRLYPTEEQKQLLEKTFGCTRYVWNHFLDKSIKDYEACKADDTLSKPDVSGHGFVIKLPVLKRQPETSWLNEVSSVALQQKLLDLEQAFQNFFGKNRKKANGYPKFKSKRYRQSFRLTKAGFSLVNGQLYLAKCLEPFKVVWSRELPSDPTSVTISKTAAGEYYVSFVCYYMPVKTNGTNITGIDLGISNLATLSTGEDIANPKHYNKTQKQLARLSRRLAKKQKGSKNRNKARIKVAKLHEHVANQRKDFLHKLSTKLVRENQALAIEDLRVANMSRNRKLAKHIMTAGWGMFRKFLEYKAIDSQHCRLVIADAYYPSTQLCSACGIKPTEKLKLHVRQWTCSSCNTTHGRDHNAGLNLKQLALKMLDYVNDKQDHSPIILAPALR